MGLFVKYDAVQIGDKFAIRRTSFFFLTDYLDLTDYGFWWRRPSKYFHDCLGTQDACEKAWEAFTAKPVVVARL